MQVGIGCGIGFNKGGGSVWPFATNANSHLWDMQFSGNTKDTVGDDTFSIVPERINGGASLIQTTKDFQPLVDVDGANFQQNSDRVMSVADLSNFSNTPTARYIATNARWDTADGGTIIIGGTTSTQVYLSGSRNWGVKIGGTWKMYSTARTLGTWYTLEMYIDTATNTITLWIDGVETAAQLNNPGVLATFPAATSISVGGTSSSLNGAMDCVFVQNSTLSAGDRTDISDYLVGRLPT